MKTVARGTFEVKLEPQDSDPEEGGTTLGRMSIDKRFVGDLEGTSQGQMLSAMTAVEGSASYVAMERVSGTLHGRKGTFVLRHAGTMSASGQTLSVTVVPDSGTGELAGLTGEMAILIADGQHSYELEYSLGDTP